MPDHLLNPWIKLSLKLRSGPFCQPAEVAAVFLGNDDKVFVVYVDQAVGAAITMFMHDTPKPRPQTHDLFADLLIVLGAKVDRVVIVSFSDSVYYARIIITVSNELEKKKIIELDARPSDAVALAIQQKAPIYIAEVVWEEVEDMSEALKKNGRERISGLRRGKLLNHRLLTFYSRQTGRRNRLPVAFLFFARCAQADFLIQLRKLCCQNHLGI